MDNKRSGQARYPSELKDRAVHGVADHDVRFFAHFKARRYACIRDWISSWRRHCRG
jgi:hypothetical protein